MDYLIIVGPRKLLANFVALATSQGYTTYTRGHAPKPGEPYVLLVDLTTKEISKFSRAWYFQYHHYRAGKLSKEERFPAFHICVNRMAALMACDLTFDYYIIKKEYREVGEPYALKCLGKCNDFTNMYAFITDTLYGGNHFYSKNAIIENLLPIKKTRYDWIVNNGNIWK